MSECVTIGDATLYHGDCLEVLNELRDGCQNVGVSVEQGRGAGNDLKTRIFDAVITDPPYGIGFKYAKHDDSSIGYIEWLWPIIESVEALCSDASPVFVWQSATNMRQLVTWFPREWRIFVAAKNFVQMRPTAMQWSFDPVLCWWTGCGKPWSAKTANRDFAIANTAPIVAAPGNIERGHPCPRPLDLLRLMVSQWVRPETLCIDPFMGSGTTGVACMQLGRKFIGIEIERKYFDIACERIENAQRQVRMFA